MVKHTTAQQKITDNNNNKQYTRHSKILWIAVVNCLAPIRNTGYEFWASFEIKLVITHYIKYIRK